MKMTLTMKKGLASFFPKLNILIHKISCVENNLYPAFIKNENGPVIMGKMCNVNGTNNSIHKIVQHI